MDFSSDEEEPEDNDSLKSEDITLDYVLTRLSISGLDRTDQVYLQAISESLSTSIPAGVDECGVAFLFAFSHLNYVKKYGRSGDKEVDSAAASWAFHSQSQAELISLIGDCCRLDWNRIRSSALPLWCRENLLCRQLIEKLARAEFQRSKDPMKAAIWFCILRKEKVLAGLFKSVKNVKMAEFFGNDFKTERWRGAALKNGYALLGHRRYYDAIAFFLLGSSLKDAIDIALNRLQDKQLALLIAMLYKGDTERLNLVSQYANDSADPFIHSLFHWMSGSYVAAVTEFLSNNHDFNDSTIYSFYRFICKHPLYIKALSIEGWDQNFLKRFYLKSKF